jgi:5'(3')-deoxyribonucleotidase
MITVAVDIDGVLCNTFAYWEKIAKQEGVTDPFDKQYNGIFKVRCSDGETFGHKLFKEYKYDWLKNSTIFPDVPKFINSLNDKSIKWYVVTARGVETKSDTMLWLEKNNIVGFERALFTKEKTVAPCNVILDDKPENVSSYTSVGRGGIIVDRPYNQGTIHKRIKTLNEFFNYYEY